MAFIQKRLVVNIIGKNLRRTKKGGDMLIFTRKNNESLFIGDDIEVTVLAIKGNQIRIGINAPKDIDVHREEVYRRIEYQNSSRNSTLSLNKLT